MVHKSSFVTGVVAILITLSTHTTLQPDNIFYNIFSHGKEITPSVSHPIPSMSYFLPGSAMCSKLDFIQSPPLVRPFSRILAGNMETHLDYVGLYCIPLCISGLVLQAVASWHSSHKSGFWFWVAFSGTVLYQHVQVQTGNYTHIAQILQVIYIYNFFSLLSVCSFLWLMSFTTFVWLFLSDNVYILSCGCFLAGNWSQENCIEETECI